MNKKIHNIDEQELKESIARLSHFLPSSKDDYGNQFLDYIVLDSMSDFGMTIVTTKEIKQTIKKNLLIDFEEDEIIGSAKRLASSCANLLKTICYLIKNKKLARCFQLVTFLFFAECWWFSVITPLFGICNSEAVSKVL
ncbi:MAG: hypothetical protein ACK4ND_16600 [Cytophagaceae bacterium]